MSEYDSLRAEIISDLESLNQYHNILFMAVTAILAFTFDSENYWSCMFPYIVILSVYFMDNSKNKAICKIGTYLDVFLEGGSDEKSHNWERRHMRFDENYLSKNVKLYQKNTLKYYLNSFSCSGITLIKLWSSKGGSIEKEFATLIVIAFTIIACLIIYDFEFSYKTERPKMIETWKEIKDPNYKKAALEDKEDVDKKKSVINAIGAMAIVMCVLIAICLCITQADGRRKDDVESGFSTETQSSSDNSQSVLFEPTYGSTGVSSQDVSTE